MRNDMHYIDEICGWIDRQVEMARPPYHTSCLLALRSHSSHISTQQHKNSVATLDGGLRLVDVKVAGDGTRKLVLEITSGAGKLVTRTWNSMGGWIHVHVNDRTHLYAWMDPGYINQSTFYPTHIPMTPVPLRSFRGGQGRRGGDHPHGPRAGPAAPLHALRVVAVGYVRTWVFVCRHKIDDESGPRNGLYF